MIRLVVLGLLVGFPIAAAPGPIFFLCLRRTLTRGWRSGLASGLGVATADAVYASLAAFGVAALTAFLVGQRRWVGLAGGLALLFLALRTLASRPQPAANSGARGEGEGGLAGAYLSMVALTLTNPQTILAFAAVFAGLGLRVASGWAAPLSLVSGVLLGSLAWWVLLTGAASLLRDRITPAVTRLITTGSGLAVGAFGGVAIVGSLR